MSTPLAFQAQTATIGDCTYSVEPLGFVEGRKAFVRLMRLFGPFLGALATIDSKRGIAANALDATIGGAIGTLLSQVEDSDLEYFQALFAPRTIVTLPDGKSPVLRDIINTHFAGARFGDYFEWLVFSLKATYGDFLKGAWTKVGKTLPQAPIPNAVSPSNSPAVSSGPNGG